MSKIKNWQKVLIVVGVVLIVFCIVLLLKTNSVSTILYFDDVQTGQKYEYICENDNCKQERIEDNYYLLNDNAHYVYSLVTGDRYEVDFTSSEIEKIIRNNDNEIYAFIIRKDREDGNLFSYLYLVGSGKTYLEEDDYLNLSFMKYEEDDISYYINLDLILAKKDDNLEVIDFVNDTVLFDYKYLDLDVEDYSYLPSLEPIKVDDNKYYYNFYFLQNPLYLLDDNFKVVVNYSSNGYGSQYEQGNQYSIYDNKIYTVNSGNKSFSVYDMNGKLIKTSKNYSYVYCVDKGYFLVKSNGKYVIINSDEKVALSLDTALPFTDGQSILVDDDTITITSIEGMNCLIQYKYDLKTNKLLEKSNECL